MNRWRNNMWVMTPDGIGILFDIAHFPSVVIHLVREDGLTKEHIGEDGKITNNVWYNIDVLRQAQYKEIPEQRRGISKDLFATLGYN